MLRLTRLDLANRCFDEATEFPALFFRDRRLYYRYWISGWCFRTNTTNATLEIPVIHE